VEALPKRGASDKNWKEIAATTGMSHVLILEWVNWADLYRIREVGGRYSDLVETAGWTPS